MTGTGSTPAKRGRRPAASAKAPANGKAPAAKTNGDKPPATAPANGDKAPAYRGYLTKDVPAAMAMFTQWISREFPELGAVDPRLVTIASKCYRYAQASDLNK